MQEMSGREGQGLLTGDIAVAIRVVATEEGVAPIALNDFVIPTQDQTRSTASKVFLIMR